MELEPLLIRAEALFRRFQRTVETIDKKGNFPAPKVIQRPNATHKSHSNPNSEPAAVASGTDAGASESPYKGMTLDSSGARDGPGSRKGKGKEEEEPTTPQGKIVSPELRELMSRKVSVLPRKVVRSKGEGLKQAQK